MARDENDRNITNQDNSISIASIPLIYLCIFLSLMSISLLFLKYILNSKGKDAKTIKIIHLLDVTVYILGWYAMSISMTLFNKWFVKVWHGGFSFVFTMGCIHMGIKSFLSSIMSWRNPQTISRISSRQYWWLCVPIGLFTGADIVMSNMSLQYITVSFFTIVKSGGNVWNLLFSIVLGLQKPSSTLLIVVVLICIGIGLASYGTIHFVFLGFLLVLSASILGTLRWVLTQFVMQRMDASQNKSLAVVYHIAPVSALSLLPIALYHEFGSLSQSVFVQNSTIWFECAFFLLCGGCISFFLIYVEIELVKKTSALSLGIAGNLKDVMQILMAMMVFHDELSPVNGLGLCIATLGLMWYSYIKATALKPSHGYATVLQTDHDDNLSIDDDDPYHDNMQRKI